MVSIKKMLKKTSHLDNVRLKITLDFLYWKIIKIGLSCRVKAHAEFFYCFSFVFFKIHKDFWLFAPFSIATVFQCARLEFFLPLFIVYENIPVSLFKEQHPFLFFLYRELLMNI